MLDESINAYFSRKTHVIRIVRLSCASLLEAELSESHRAVTMVDGSPRAPSLEI